MKHLRLFVCLSIIAFSASAAVALADDAANCSSCQPETERIAVSKESDSKAKVYFSNKDSVSVPIKFGTDASWDNVHDNYNISEEYASLIKEGKICITINSDGSASFNVVKCHSESSKKKK